MAEGGFNPDTYSHVLPAGQQDFDDYDEGDLTETPELGYSDEQVAAEVAKLTEEERELVSTNQDLHRYILPKTWIHRTIRGLSKDAHDREVP